MQVRAKGLLVIGGLGALGAHAVLLGRDAAVGVYLAGVVLAAVVVWLGIALNGPVDRRPWILVAVGLTLVTLADLTYDLVYRVLLDQPDPQVSWADPMYLIGYAFLTAGVVAVARGERSGHDVDLFIDVVALGLAAGITLAMFVVVPGWEVGGELDAETLLAVGYPIASVTVGFAALRLLLSSMGGTVAGRTLAGGAALLSLGDMVWFAQEAGAGYEPGLWLDTVWLAASLLIGFSTLHPSMVEIPEPKLPSARTSFLRVAVTAGCLAVPGAVLALDNDHAMHAGGLRYVWLFLIAVLWGLIVLRGQRLSVARRVADGETERLTHFYRAIAENSSDVTLLVDAEGTILEASPTYQAVVGGPFDEPRGLDIFVRVNEADREFVRRNFALALENPGLAIEGELRVEEEDGSERWLSARLVNLLGDSAVGAVLLNLQDVTSRHRVEAELRDQAYTDPLTGVANRARLRERMNGSGHRRRGEGGWVALLLVDVCDHSQVTERLGHDAGDELLRQVARRIKTVIRGEDTVAHLSGSEFAILMEQHQAGIDEASALARRVQQAVAEPLAVSTEPLVVETSIGIALAAAGSDHDLLLRDAGLALTEARRRGPGKVAFFEPRMRVEAADRIRLANDLKSALSLGQFELHYQPVVELETGRITGAEALLRWQHPELGTVAPLRFVPLAEESGLIVEIGAWVIREAAATAARWCASSGDLVSVSVNVAAQQLVADDFVSTVREAIADAGIAPGGFAIEITESTLIADVDLSVSRLTELHDLGVTIAVDDFGTGYSSLSYLQQFPVDVLKIDRSFVATLKPDQSMPRLVKGVLDLATTLDLISVAEGIEEESQLGLLRTEGCKLGQGYLFSRPVPAGVIASLIEQRHLEPAGS